MSRRLVFQPTAEFDLAAIYDLVAADSPRSAFDFIGDIIRRCTVWASGVRYLGQRQ